MRIGLLIPTCILIAGVLSCDSKADLTNAAEIGPEVPVKDVIINPYQDLSNTGDPYAVDSISIENKVLSVFVNYPGGCRTHSFELYASGKLEASKPAKAILCLRHYDDTDKCKTQIIQEVKFNLADLKYPKTKTVLLKIGDRTVKYAFK